MPDTLLDSKPAEALFTGRPSKLLGRYTELSNAMQLVRLCPPEFRTKNPWRTYAAKLMNYGGSTDHWVWKSKDPTVQKHQHACFLCVHAGQQVYKWEDMVAVGGWMLSEMLAEVPEHVIPVDYKPPQI